MRRGIAVTGALLITAMMLAGCGDNESSESTPPDSSETEESAPDVSEDAATPEDEASAPVELVDVVVISYEAHNYIAETVLKDESNACAELLPSLQSANSVELAVAGENSPRAAGWSPSTNNGSPFPCRVEALFEGVPAEADSYTATQVGESKVKYETTVTGAELAAAGNEIMLVKEAAPVVSAEPSEDEGESKGDSDGGLGVIGGVDVDAFLDAECLSGENSFLKIYKNYSKALGPGRGDDIFVMSREKMTNNCDKDIKAFSYSIIYYDVFGDKIYRGDSKPTMRIKAGRSKQTRKTRATSSTLSTITFKRGTMRRRETSRRKLSCGRSCSPTERNSTRVCDAVAPYPQPLA